MLHTTVFAQNVILKHIRSDKTTNGYIVYVLNAAKTKYLCVFKSFVLGVHQLKKECSIHASTF